MEKKILESIEYQAQRYIELNEEKKRIEEKLEQTKHTLFTRLQQSGESEVLVFHNNDKSIKVKLNVRNQLKIDKEKMADDLGVALDSIRTKNLLHWVEDGKLTRNQYEQYEYVDSNEGVSVRLVNAE